MHMLGLLFVLEILEDPKEASNLNKMDLSSKSKRTILPFWNLSESLS